VIVRRPEPRQRRRIELALAALLGLSSDGLTPAPLGELAAAVRLGRVAVALRGQLSSAWSQAAATPSGVVTLEERRVLLAADVHLDVDVPRGAVRVGAGPMCSLWLVQPGGVPHARSSLLAEPGIEARAAYRLAVGRTAFGAGVAADVALLRDDLTVAGVGVVARTPLIMVLPFVEANVNFL
jgi:hypothetical protein